MKKKPSRKTQKNKCDKLWSQIIRGKVQCEACGKPGNNPHHVIGRSNHNLRWDLRNGCLLCPACHFEVHNNPIKFMDWFSDWRKDDCEYLRKKQNEFWDKDYDKVLEYLKEAE